MRRTFSMLWPLLVVAAFLFLFCGLCLAEDQTPYNNIFAAGASYDNIASPGITLGLLDAKLIIGGTMPLYNFTAVDLTPQFIQEADPKTGQLQKKFHCQTAVTTGAASLLRELGPLGKLWVIGTIGGGAQGDNSGLAWSAGGAFTRPIGKAGVLLITDLRVLKISGADYQGRIGLKIGWGSK